MSGYNRARSANVYGKAYEPKKSEEIISITVLIIK